MEEGLGWSLPNWVSTRRIGLVRAAAKWMKSAISTNRQRLPEAVAVLYLALDDPDNVITDVAAACLRPIVQSFPENTWIDNVNTRVEVTDIKKRLNQFSNVPKTDFAFNIELKIQELLKPTEVGKPTSADSNESNHNKH